MLFIAQITLLPIISLLPIPAIKYGPLYLLHNNNLTLICFFFIFCKKNGVKTLSLYVLFAFSLQLKVCAHYEAIGIRIQHVLTYFEIRFYFKVFCKGLQLIPVHFNFKVACSNEQFDNCLVHLLNNWPV